MLTIVVSPTEAFDLSKVLNPNINPEHKIYWEQLNEVLKKYHQNKSSLTLEELLKLASDIQDNIDTIERKILGCHRTMRLANYTKQEREAEFELKKLKPNLEQHNSDKSILDRLMLLLLREHSDYFKVNWPSSSDISITYGREYQYQSYLGTPEGKSLLSRDYSTLSVNEILSQRWVNDLLPTSYEVMPKDNSRYELNDYGCLMAKIHWYKLPALVQKIDARKAQKKDEGPQIEASTTPINPKMR